MEGNFKNFREEMQRFSAQRSEIENNCKATIQRIELDATLKKNQAKADMNDQMLIIAQKEDDFINAYNEWKLQQKANQPQE